MKEHLVHINNFVHEIPASGKMRVPVRLIASTDMLPTIFNDKAPEQACNVAWLPGIVRYSYAMPDIHWGYGFPIGGVAAFDIETGVVSPGGVGYDINCGVRLLRTDLKRSEIEKKLEMLMRTLFNHIPSGVGSTGSIKLEARDLKQVLVKGARWAVEQGYGSEKDLDKIEEHGEMAGADPQQVSEHAHKRGRPQLGTLGSGNHFIEVGFVQEIYDARAAAKLGLFLNQVSVIIHTGSRGLGHQVCDDSIRMMLRASEKYGIDLPDRQLCCAPIQSPEGQAYLAAMAAAVNFAFCNRQMIAHWTGQAFKEIFSSTLELATVYEVAHNIAKIESHTIDGKLRRLCVHRKGATRAFGPGHPDLPAEYREFGQPVLIPGDMGRCSYVLVGTQAAQEQTFGSTCHGAGRLLSRTQAIKIAKGRNIQKELRNQGVIVAASSSGTLAEEMPEAYKNVTQVVDAVVGADISRRVAKLVPLGVVKG
ncbi:MAG TPA: RtcB family protein [bacterium]|nr:RtcB family protein [bacterium]HPG44587.1 RtcB family protein [bacterium]HPM97145.1 RtcB family protein [bacterium]